jgi:predicted nucleic acid-binding protein
VRFWDSSAIVPLLARQTATPRAEELFASDSRMTVWWGTPVECASALGRLQREREIDARGVAAARLRLREFSRIWDDVQPGEALRENAARLVFSLGLRAGDALQLAAAVAASGERPSALEFVCFDLRLAEAAQKEGFRVVTA